MRGSRPGGVEVVEHVWIPMPDGCRLAAKLWIPEGARRRPVPAVLESIPYRKRDTKAVRDTEIHGFFAERGYAGVRVDLRGSGDSEGVLRDEYLPQELDDGVAVLEWMAAQPWCNGRLGLFGLSWGGFNGLQLAARRPAGLQAVITVCSSDDRYSDDVHYMGGCLLTDNLSWASVMLSYNSTPPDPETVGPGWRAMWHERLEGSGLWLRTWLEHQRRDAYWRNGSVCEELAAIRCPVLAVSGWADGYCNTVFRLMEGLPGPRKGLVGPWGHKYPHMGGPGPAIDFLSECVRWWERWLGDVENGIDREPRVRAWMQESVSPLSDDRPGRWVVERSWPSPRIEWRRRGLAPGRLLLEGESAPDAAVGIRSPLHVGLFAGKWCSYAESTDLPTDQRLEDGGSLVFDGPPLEEALEILGAPELEVELASSAPQALAAVRLSDVHPDGTATLVTYGLLNLSHRESHEHPEPLVPGERTRVRVRLNHVGQRFPAGHRLRLALSSSYWPLAWPAPEPATLTVHTGPSALLLPARAPAPEDAELKDYGPPKRGPSPPTTQLRAPRREWKVEFNLATNEATLLVVDDDALYRLDELGLTVGYEVTERYGFDADAYDTVYGEVRNRRLFEREGWRVVTETRTLLTATATHFRIHATLDAYEDDLRVFSRQWDERIPRDHL